MKKLISPKSYSHKREIVIRKGDEITLESILIGDGGDVILSLNKSNRKIKVSYNNIYEALNDGWNINTKEIKEHIKRG